jgi:hypothetical protein
VARKKKPLPLRKLLLPLLPPLTLLPPPLLTLLLFPPLTLLLLRPLTLLLLRLMPLPLRPPSNSLLVAKKAGLRAGFFIFRLPLRAGNTPAEVPRSRHLLSDSINRLKTG